MSPEFRRVKEVFLAALEKEGQSERDAYVRDTCAGDEVLQRQVEALLIRHENAGSFLEESAADKDLTMDQPPAEGPGAIIGPYKLIEEIGEGGMGAVYLAQQTEPVKRLVALKVIKAGMDSRQVIARFEAERQALALMDHSNIAKVLDAGTTSTGRPYFVMELVKGTPITKFCDERKLTPRQRLELFLPVCHAIQHAHQKGIIHRDIKPTNVLVALYDGQPVPKVIDFGVAKATGQPLTERTLVTGLGAVVGTPEYMSPEQAELNQLDIDTRSDVYSLGVLLYELLTGTTPLTRKRLKEAALLEVLRVIREEELQRPSTRLSTTEELPSIAAVRGVEPAKLSRLVRGELDWIVMKALEKDRNRRYETANGFAADVQRYLADEAVQACPPSVGYRLRKFARRNKRQLIIGSILGVSLLFAMASLGWVARDRAEQRMRTGVRVDEFLQRAEALYTDNKLLEALAEVEKSRGVLDAGRGEKELDHKVRQWQTDLETAIELEELWLAGYDREKRNLGDAEFAQLFREYGIDVEAQSVEEAAARVATSRIRLDLAQALRTWSSNLRVDSLRKDLPRSQRLRAIARIADPDPWRERLGLAIDAKDVQSLRDLAKEAVHRRMRTRTLGYLGTRLRDFGDVDAGVAFLREAQRQYPGDFVINSNLAVCLSRLKSPPWNEVITFRRIAVSVRPQSSWAHANLGDALARSGHLDEAIIECREAIRLRPGNVFAYTCLGIVLGDQKKLDESIAALRRALELDSKNTYALNNLGIALQDHQQKLDEAIACYRKVIDTDPTYVAAHYNLGNAWSKQKKLKEAIACYRKVIDLDSKHANAHNNLGNALQDQQKLDEAIACYRKAIDADPTHVDAHYNVGNALRKQEKFDEAVAAYRKAIELDPKDAGHYSYNLGFTLRKLKKLDEAIAAYRKTIEHNSKNAAAHHALGLCLFDQKRYDEANAAYREAISLKQDFASAHKALGDSLLEQNKPAEAISEFGLAIAINKKIGSFHNGLGIALFRQKRLEEAVAAYHEAIALDSHVAIPRSNLGDALLNLNRTDDAIAAYRDAIAVDPNHISAHINLGIALGRKEKLDEAIAAYKEAIRLDPGSSSAYFNLGRALSRKGCPDEAIAAYEATIRLKADHISSRVNLAWLLSAGPDSKLWDGKRAVEMMIQVEALGGKNAYCLRAKGLAHYRAGNWIRSLAALDEAMELTKGGDGYHWFWLALAHFRLGNDPEARKWYRKSVEWMDSIKPKDETGELRRLRAEAEKLLGG